MCVRSTASRQQVPFPAVKFRPFLSGTTQDDGKQAPEFLMAHAGQNGFIRKAAGHSRKIGDMPPEVNSADDSATFSRRKARLSAHSPLPFPFAVRPFPAPHGLVRGHGKGKCRYTHKGAEQPDQQLPVYVPESCQDGF